jgi:hypothetical protein
MRRELVGLFTGGLLLPPTAAANTQGPLTLNDAQLDTGTAGASFAFVSDSARAGSQTTATRLKPEKAHQLTSLRSLFGRSLLVIALLALLSSGRFSAASGQDMDCPLDLPFIKYLCDQREKRPATLTSPIVFVVYWGSDWGDGTNGSAFPQTVGTVSISEPEYITYLELFLDTIGGTPYLDTQTQYGAANPQHILADHWFDPSPVPDTPSNDDMSAEAQRAYSHFAQIGFRGEPIFVIALPPHHGQDWFKSGKYCAYHSYANAIPGQSDSPFAYWISLPFQPDRANCVDPGSDGFGHGILDAVSTLAGHELAETLTDPVDGSWKDTYGNETGDKCQSQPRTNIGNPGGNFYWQVQSLWSNDVGGCLFGDNADVKPKPSVIDFGSVGWGEVSGTLHARAQNIGTADFPNVGYPSFELDDRSNSFTVSSPVCPNTLHPGDFCDFPVQFIPQYVGDATATLYFNGYEIRGDLVHFASFLLKGTGAPVRSPIAVQVGIFEAILAGAAANCETCKNVVQPIFMVNQDNQPHRVSSVRITNINLPTIPVGTSGAIAAADSTTASHGEPEALDFVIANDGCSGSTLSAGQSCAVRIRFSPQATGQRFARLDFLDETGTPHSAPIKGVGLGPAVQLAGSNLSALGLGFPQSQLGKTQVQQVTLTSSGEAALSIGSIRTRGDFAQTNNCPPLLAVGSSCTINVSLTPTHYQFQNGTLTITDDASDSPQLVRLTGVAAAPWALVSPKKLNFACEPVSVASDPLKVTLSTMEGEAFLISSIMISGDFMQTNDCPSKLTSFCTISVVFEPTKKGNRAGRLTIFDNATNGIQSVGLSGKGIAKECEGLDDDGERRDCEDRRRAKECDEPLER